MSAVDRTTSQFHSVSMDSTGIWIIEDTECPSDPAGIEMLAMSAPTMPHSAEVLAPVLEMVRLHIAKHFASIGVENTMTGAYNELGRIYMVLAGKIMRCYDIDSAAVEAVRS